MKSFYLLIFQLFCYCSFTIISAENQSNNDFASLAHSINSLGFSLYKTMNTKIDGNFVISPLNTAITLATLYLGSNGNSHTQLQNTLKLNISGNENLPLIFGTYLVRLLYQWKSNKVESARFIFINKYLDYVPAFLKMIRKFFNTDIIRQNFLKKPRLMNYFFKEKTNQKIGSITNRRVMTNITSILLADGLYFQGKFKQANFLNKDKKIAKFYLDNNRESEVNMMYTKDYFYILKSVKPKCRIIEFPFAEKFSLFIIIPDKNVSLKELERDLPFSVVEKIVTFKSFKKSLTQIGLPAFEMTTKIEFKKYLKQLGIKDIFHTYKNGFHKVFRANEKVFIDKVIQKTVIKVGDHYLNKAFKKTYFGCKNSFDVDRPFIFLVVDKLYNITILMGRIVDPNSKNTEE